MTAIVTMSQAMEARLRALTARAFSEAAMKFDRALQPTMTQPMPGLSNTIVFRVTTTVGEVREFAAMFSLTELTGNTTPPTDGYSR